MSPSVLQRPLCPYTLTLSYTLCPYTLMLLLCISSGSTSARSPGHSTFDRPAEGMERSLWVVGSRRLCERSLHQPAVAAAYASSCHGRHSKWYCPGRSAGIWLRCTVPSVPLQTRWWRSPSYPPHCSTSLAAGPHSNKFCPSCRPGAGTHSPRRRHSALSGCSGLPGRCKQSLTIDISQSLRWLETP